MPGDGMEQRAARSAGGRPACYQCFQTPCTCTRRASAANTAPSAVPSDAVPSAVSTSSGLHDKMDACGNTEPAAHMVAEEGSGSMIATSERESVPSGDASSEEQSDVLALSQPLHASQMEEEDAGEEDAAEDGNELDDDDKEAPVDDEEDSGVLMDEVADEEEVHTQLSRKQFGENSPAKRKSGVMHRAGAGYTKGVWLFIKRLKDVALMELSINKDTGVISSRFTHVCIKCWRLIKMSYNNQEGRWLTTKDNEHEAQFHPDTFRAQKKKKLPTRRSRNGSS